MNKTFATILTTVNAPYQEQLDGANLAACLSDVTLAKSKPGHVSSFFGEVFIQSQKDFALHHDITIEQLTATAADFAAYSGEKYALNT